SRSMTVEAVGLTFDRSAKGLTWDQQGGTVGYSYEIDGGNGLAFPGDVTVALYWASGPTIQTLLGGPAFQKTYSSPQTGMNQDSVPVSQLSARPGNATYLLE